MWQSKKWIQGNQEKSISRGKQSLVVQVFKSSEWIDYDTGIINAKFYWLYTLTIYYVDVCIDLAV